MAVVFNILTCFYLLSTNTKENGWFLCHQFETDANWKIHYETTGPEICNDLDGKLDYWVTGYGTGGTFHGTGKYIKEHSPHTQIILAEPSAANLVGSGIKTERMADGSPAGSHPAFAAHPIQGTCVRAPRSVRRRDRPTAFTESNPRRRPH